MFASDISLPEGIPVPELALVFTSRLSLGFSDFFFIFILIVLEDPRTELLARHGFGKAKVCAAGM
jgi:hypothetical protein